ncbi:hypothetical protein TeGR_g2016, partial [Tetraparma gracilis]
MSSSAARLALRAARSPLHPLLVSRCTPHSARTGQPPAVRYLSAKPEAKPEPGGGAEPKVEPKLEEQADPAAGAASSSSSSFKPPPIPDMPSSYEAKQSLLSFWDGVQEAWTELVGNKPKAVVKNVAKPVVKREDGSVDPGEQYDGPTELMAVDPDQSAWDRMKQRMTEAPIIEEILKNSKKFSKAAGIDKARAKYGDIRDDAAEAWETSQNPWVYRLSSVYDQFMSESDHALVTKELRRLDPDFDMEDWTVSVVETVLPQLFEDYMKGNASKIRPWLGDAVWAKVSAE